MSGRGKTTSPARRGVYQDGAAAILDQFLFTGSSSLLVLVLGRLLPPEQYGAFVLAYSTFLLLGQAQTALFGEPMTVFASTRFRASEQGYLRVVRDLNLRSGAFVGGILLLLGASLAALGRKPMGMAFVGAGIAMPLLLSAWLRRRALYLQGRIWRSVAASGLFLVGCMAGVGILHWFAHLSVLTGMIILGLASCLAIAVSPLGDQGPKPELSLVLQSHWEYGRWALLTAILGWSGNLYYFLLPIWNGLGSAAALRSILNFTYPMIQVNQAVALYLLPRWAQRSGEGGFSISLAKSVVAWSVFAIVLCLSALAVGPRFMHWVYGGKYDEFAYLMPLAILLALPDGISYLLGNALRAIGTPMRVATAALVLPVVALLPGLLMMKAWGVKGAMGALLIASIAQLSLNGWGWRQSLRKRVCTS